MIGTLENNAGAGVDVKASDLLANQLKKFTMDMPVSMHQQLKMIAAGQQTTVRALVMEAVVEHVIPKYTKGVK
jgi:hypothetical protein